MDSRATKGKSERGAPATGRDEAAGGETPKRRNKSTKARRQSADHQIANWQSPIVNRFDFLTFRRFPTAEVSLQDGFVPSVRFFPRIRVSRKRDSEYPVRALVTCSRRSRPVEHRIPHDKNARADRSGAMDWAISQRPVPHGTSLRSPGGRGTITHAHAARRRQHPSASEAIRPPPHDGAGHPRDFSYGGHGCGHWNVPPNAATTADRSSTSTTTHRPPIHGTSSPRKNA